MKVLYAIQGTGNGHLSRARDIIPHLQKKCDLDIMVSGIQADVSLPFEIKYTHHGLSFIFGKKGGINFIDTYIKANSRKLFKDIRQFPVKDYDLVINDFEPVSAWAAFFRDVPCVALSHQCAVLAPASPKPTKTDWVSKLILQYYAPTGAKYGFHFDRFDSFIHTPVIRKDIRDAAPTNKGHYSVYLPAYSDEKIFKILSKIKGIQWQVFSKHARKSYHKENLQFAPVNNEAFIESLLNSEGVLCGAGFETPAEALFLKKKVMVIPMKSQYEQQCNAAAAASLGVPVIKKLKKKYIPQIEDWVARPFSIEVDYPDETEQILEKILTNHERNNILPVAAVN